MADRDTLRQDEPPPLSSSPPRGLDELFADRYESLDLIGQGGMGEVRLCRDGRIGRDVAMKVIRQGSGSGPPNAEQRFLREACVQAQLEHPAIVPVYDLGRDPGGRAFFTMKRVNGVTLEEVLDRLANGDPAAAREWTRRKLLTAFTNLCLALDYAHERGVLHRDLKPANVMLGGFGEVYLLDWGLARVGELAQGSVLPLDSSSDKGDAGATLAGSILGTPNYMSPEQARGEIETLDRRSDVYALGALLFEILAGELLCRADDVRGILDETLRGADARIGARAPEREVPPELEAICVRATQKDRNERYPTARELCQAVERFLDGDRDLALRRELSDRHAAAAHENAALADADTDARVRALRECGRALALDASNRSALETLLGLLTRPPRKLPKAAEVEYLRVEQESQRDAGRVGFFAYASWFLYLPFVLWMGIKDWTLFFVPGPIWIAAAIQAWLVWKNPHPEGKLPYPLIFVSGLAVATTAVMFGAFVLLPSIAVVNTISFMMSHDRTRRPAVLVAGLLSLLLPLLLEVTGVFPPSYRFENDVLTVTSLALHLPPVPSKLFLLFTNLAVVVTAALLVGRMRDLLTAKERQLHLQAWQLRQLVPGNTAAPPRPPVASCALGLGD